MYPSCPTATATASHQHKPTSSVGMAETGQPVGPVRLQLLPLFWLLLNIPMVCSSLGDTAASSFVVPYRVGSSLHLAVSYSRATRRPREPRTPASHQHQSRPNKPILAFCLASTAAIQPHIPILLETERFLVIEKPAGIPHHSDPPPPNCWLENGVRGDDTNASSSSSSSVGILHLLRAQRAAAATEERLYGVHRLDRVTSGILLVAKDAVAAAAACRAFREGRVTKYYTGLSCHKPNKKKQGWIQGNMVRGRRKSWYLTSSSRTGNNTTSCTDESSKNFAKTRFFSAGLGHLPSPFSNNDASAEYSAAATTAIRTLLFFRPYTGQTHQLRVAAKSVGLPLAGDPIYKDSNSNSKMSPCARTYLHATGLHIPASALSFSLSHDESLEHGDLTVWCPPPFESSAWEDNPGAQAGFRQALQTLVEKHCDCPPLLELATSAYLKSDGHDHQDNVH